MRRNSLSANKVSRIYRLNQTVVSKWNRQIDAGLFEQNKLNASSDEHEVKPRTKRDSAESLSTLFILSDDILPKLIKYCVGQVIYHRLTDPFYPARKAGEEAWRAICCELGFCQRDIQSMTVILKIDHDLLHQIYERMLLVKEAWIAFRNEQVSYKTETCNEREEKQSDDYGIQEEQDLIDKLLGHLRQLVIVSHPPLVNFLRAEHTKHCPSDVF